jgi:hypothetical protein
MDGRENHSRALVRLDESTDPMQADYYNVGGAGEGTIQ